MRFLLTLFPPGILQLISQGEGHAFMSENPSSFKVILRFTEGSIYAPRVKKG